MGRNSLWRLSHNWESNDKKMKNKRKKFIFGACTLIICAVVSVVYMTGVRDIDQSLPFSEFQEEAPNAVLKAQVTQDNGMQVLQFQVEQTIDHQRPFYEFKMMNEVGELVQYQAVLGQQFIFGIGDFQQKKKVTEEQLQAMRMNADAQVINTYFFEEEQTQPVYDTIEYVGKELVIGRSTYRFRCGYEKSQQISHTEFTKEVWLDEETGITLRAIETTNFQLQDDSQPLATTFQKTFEVSQFTLNERTS